MALRKCAVCGESLPAGSTARAKFCSATCRKRASRTRADGPALQLVSKMPKSTGTRATRLEALEAAAERLVRLLDEADPRSAAALNKEYRETLREVEALREAAGEPEAGHGRTGGGRRPFNASAV